MSSTGMAILHFFTYSLNNATSSDSSPEKRIDESSPKKEAKPVAAVNASEADAANGAEANGTNGHIDELAHGQVGIPGHNSFIMPHSSNNA
jgi:hypothetical protein